MHWMAFYGATIFNHKGLSLDLCYIETLKLKNDYFIFWLQFNYRLCGICFIDICIFHSDLSSFLKFYFVWLVRSSATMSLEKLSIFYVTQIFLKKTTNPIFFLNLRS
jgi:hypothetical protein